jgi:hypothetical protein
MNARTDMIDQINDSSAVVISHARLFEFAPPSTGSFSLSDISFKPALNPNSKALATCAFNFDSKKSTIMTDNESSSHIESAHDVHYDQDYSISCSNTCQQSCAEIQHIETGPSSPKLRSLARLFSLRSASHSASYLSQPPCINQPSKKLTTPSRVASKKRSSIYISAISEGSMNRAIARSAKSSLGIVDSNSNERLSLKAKLRSPTLVSAIRFQNNSSNSSSSALGMVSSSRLSNPKPGHSLRKTNRRAMADAELALGRERKVCAICLQAKLQCIRKFSISTSMQSNAEMVGKYCHCCDDYFHKQCLPLDSDISILNWMCPSCTLDRELKTEGHINVLQPKLSHPSRLLRPFSSAWLSETARHTRDFSKFESLPASYDPAQATLSLAVLLQPARPLYDLTTSSNSDPSALSRLKINLLGLAPSLVRSSPLKLPRYSDRTDEQRAEARHMLANAMRESGMEFSDDVKYPFRSCTQVTVFVSHSIFSRQQCFFLIFWQKFFRLD